MVCKRCNGSGWVFMGSGVHQCDPCMEKLKTTLDPLDEWLEAQEMIAEVKYDDDVDRD